jgi:hypothetical protein
MKHRTTLPWHVWCLVTLLGLLLVWFTVPWPPEWIEYGYSRGIYPIIAQLMIPVTALFPFSLAAVLLVSLPVLWLAGCWFAARRVRSVWQGVRRCLYLSLWLIALLTTGFVVTWGANYQRQPIEALLNLQLSLIPEQDVLELLDYLQTVIETYSDAEADVPAALRAAREAIQDVTEELTGVRPTLPASVKRLPPGTLIRLGSAYGVISPWTLEAHVDGALPDIAVVGVGTHELVHLSGLAGEADTDLLAAIAGLQATHPYTRYATALRFWELTARRFPASRRAALRQRLPERAQTDLVRMAAPFQTYRPPPLLEQTQRLTYDVYLRSQGVESGIADYGRAVTLIVWAYHQGHLPELPQ